MILASAARTSAFELLAPGGLFLLLRGPTAGLLPVHDGVWAFDIRPATTSIVLIVVAVPLLAAAAGPLALRRVVTTPLGVTRQAVHEKYGR